MCDFHERQSVDGPWLAVAIASPSARVRWRVSATHYSPETAPFIFDFSR